MRLEGKTALITGGAEGIGRACSMQFAQQGAAVVIADFNDEAALKTVDDIRQEGGQAAFVETDVSNAKQVQNAVEFTVARFNKLDALICNAGLGGRKLGDGPVHECTEEGWDYIMSVNLKGVFLTCKYAIPYMIEAGNGSIITMSSILGLVGTQNIYSTHAYTTSKAAIIGLTRNIAAHYAQNGLRANSIAPGLIDTRMANRTKATPELLEKVSYFQPLGPIGGVDDVAAAAVYLASDESKFVTGIVLSVDGGWSAQ